MKCIKIHQSDSVAVAVELLNKGELVTVDGNQIELIDSIPAGHKFALKDIKSGENIIKYAYPIGHAKCDIKIGEHIHTQNTKSNLSALLDYQYNPNFCDLEKTNPLTFMGYKRPDGKVGIRNEVWIIPTVGCVNSIVREIEAQSQQFKTENIDGIYLENWGAGWSGVCVEIYDSKSKDWQTYSGEYLRYGYIDLSEIQNGAECTIKVSVTGENFFAGRFYLA